MKSQEDELYQEASTSVADYVENSTPVRKEKGKRRKKSIFIVIALVLVAGGAAAYFLTKPKKTAEMTQAPAQTTQAPEAELVTSTENFVSPSFRLSFDHPTNWKVDEIPASADTSAEIVVRSPTIKLKDAEGKEVSAQVMLRIRPKSNKLTDIAEGANIVALRPSEKISYSQPSSQQRGETFLTYLQHTGAGLDAVYITGDNGYEKEAFVPKTDLVQSDPIISVSFLNCSDLACNAEAASALSISDTEWEENKFIQQAKTILQSLNIN